VRRALYSLSTLAVVLLGIIALVSYCTPDGENWEAEARALLATEAMQLPPPQGSLVESGIIPDCGNEAVQPGAFTTFDTEADASEIRNFYASELPKLGWQLDEGSSTFSGTVDGTRAWIDLYISELDVGPYEQEVELYGYVAEAGPCPAD
jgi:hypothetical protein